MEVGLRNVVPDSLGEGNGVVARCAWDSVVVYLRVGSGGGI